MQHDARVFLFDVLVAIEKIESFLTGLDKESYLASVLVQSAVERQFILIGEALNQLSRMRPEGAGSVRDTAAIVAFRNQIVHGYRLVNSARVYDIARQNLPALKIDVQQALSAL